MKQIESSLRWGEQGTEPWHLLLSIPDFIEMLPVAACGCDAAGHLLWFNRRAITLWGNEPRIGDDADGFCGCSRPPVEVGRLDERGESPMARALQTGTPVQNAEVIIERPDGTRVWAMLHVEPVKADDGRVVGAITCFHDTTELHRVRSLVVETEEWYRQILEGLPAAVYTTDAEGRITYFNRAAAELSGREPELGKDHWCVSWRLFSPDGTPMAHDACPMAITLRENRPIRNVEAVAERPDGTMVPFLPFPTPLRDRAGNLVGAVNMLIDISERKQAETRQLVLQKELNHRVKNNMQTLQSLLGAAQRSAGSMEARTVLHDACRRVAAMAAAQAVLYEEGAPTTFTISDFLASVCQTTRDSFPIEPDIVVDATADCLPNDTAIPLALILSELLTNAVKHGANGNGAAVRVTLGRCDQGYELRVEDDGPGFELGLVRNRASGLGLVSGLARQLGGSLAVERSDGAHCIVRFPERRAGAR